MFIYVVETVSTLYNATCMLDDLNIVYSNTIAPKMK